MPATLRVSCSVVHGQLDIALIGALLVAAHFRDLMPRSLATSGALTMFTSESVGFSSPHSAACVSARVLSPAAVPS